MVFFCIAKQQNVVYSFNGLGGGLPCPNPISPHPRNQPGCPGYEEFRDLWDAVKFLSSSLTSEASKSPVKRHCHLWGEAHGVWEWLPQGRLTPSNS